MASCCSTMLHVPFALLVQGHVLPPPPLLVCTTAASLEGMAFCRHALRNPGEYRVRALVRNPESERAKKLASLGAEVVIADNHDPASLKDAFDGAHSIYAITTWSGSSFQADGTAVRSANLKASHLEESEVAQGINILRAAKDTPSLRHFVLQSMHRGGREPLDAATPAPLHHRAKWRQEEALRESPPSCAWSILRQPTYLENFANDNTAAAGTKLRVLRPGSISGLLAPDEELTVISVDDLGAMAVAMLRRGPEQYAGRVVAAGAARVSGRGLAEAASRAHGQCTFEYSQVPWFVLRFLIPVDYPRQLQRWLSVGGNDEGAAPDAAAMLAESRELHPQMKSVEEWLVAQGVRELPSPARRAPTAQARRAVLRTALGAAPALFAAGLVQAAGPAAKPTAPLATSALLASRDRGHGH